jgi:hypothetical protein
MPPTIVYDQSKLTLSYNPAPRANTMTTMTLRFAFEKETKGAVRFQEVGEDGKPAFAPSIGTLYIRKSALPDGKIPQTLTVMITI